MSTPQQQPQKTSRRSGKKSRQQDSPAPQNKTSPNSAQKNNNVAATGNGQPRRPSHAQNRHHNDGNISDRPRTNHSHLEKTKATPVKQAAYAGSTFQQSPAASALPIPSFYSKSLPTTTAVPEQSSKETSPPIPVSDTPTDDSPSKRESTPLDFLFEAARKAKATPRGESPASHAGNVFAMNESPASGSPAPREADSMFPFELEGGATPGEDGSSFATPYKDRMAVFRSTKSTGPGSVKTMDEAERREKSEALKKLLMNSGGSISGDQYNPAGDANNPFNARQPYQTNGYGHHGPPQAIPPVRPSSNPSVPFYNHDHRDYNAPQGFPHAPYHYLPASTHTPKRPPSSSLRNVYQSEPEYAELSSDSAITPPISTGRKQAGHGQRQQHQQTRYGTGPIGQPYAPQPQVPNHQSKPSAQQLEDDLRRVLKLDLISRG